jgi:hypothetical protein
LSVEGAKLLQGDLRHMMEQIRLQLPSEPVWQLSHKTWASL